MRGGGVPSGFGSMARVVTAKAMGVDDRVTQREIMGYQQGKDFDKAFAQGQAANAARAAKEAADRRSLAQGIKEANAAAAAARARNAIFAQTPEGKVQAAKDAAATKAANDRLFENNKSQGVMAGAAPVKVGPPTWR
jgi:hypothetical protein